MNDWDSLTQLCDYLEHLSQEMDENIMRTRNEATKLGEILDTISPVPVSEPKEEAKPQKLIQNRKVFRGFDYKVAQKPSNPFPSEDTFGDFLNYFEQYKRVSKFDRKHFGDRFAKRIMDFSRMTAAHLYNRMVPCIHKLNEEFDKILTYDLEQPNLKYRAKYTTDRAAKVVQEYDRLVAEFGLNRRVDVLSREKQLEPPPKPPKKVEVEDQFEVLANLTPKQLNSLYALRGSARKSMMNCKIREKTEQTFMHFLRKHDPSSDEAEDILYLKAASSCFKILSHDHRSFALVARR